MNAVLYSTGNDYSLKRVPIYSTNETVYGAMQITSSASPLEAPFEGFGVAITGASCYELSTMSKEVRSKFLNEIYGKDGLGLTVGRISIGASDYSAELYSYDDVPDDIELKHFSIERDEAYVIPMIKEVLEIVPEISLLASPWSPPGWMKTGGSMCGGHMLERYIEVYAEYIVKFIKAYEEHGIKISSLTPQNEPGTAQNGCMPACIWNPDTEAKYINLLREKLCANGYGTEIMMHDHNFAEWHKILWMLKEYPELLENSGSVAFHYYNGVPEQIEHIRSVYPKLRFHFTEGGPQLLNNYATDWCKWGLTMSRALNNGMLSFHGWNLLLDETGGPNIGPFFCGGLATLNSMSGELSYSGQYHAFNHFSRFIKKGALIYPTYVTPQKSPLFSYPKNSIPIECTAAENPDGSFVLQIINPGPEKAQLQYRYGGELWYMEVLANTVNTVVFEKETV